VSEEDYSIVKFAATAQSQKMPNPAILVTGFGPFGTHTQNASLEAVLKLPSMWTDREVDLIVEEVPVRYDFVRNAKFRMLHPERKILASIHCGVSSKDNKITLERRARNYGYSSQDIDEKSPQDQLCIDCRPKDEVLSTNLDVPLIAKCVSNVDTSEDAGLYLCEFIYYKSLVEMGGNSLFIHVPTEDVLKSEDAAKTIKSVIQKVVEIVKK